MVKYISTRNDWDCILSVNSISEHANKKDCTK